VAESRPIIANPWSKRTLYAAIAVAFLLHLAVLTPFVVRPAPSPADAVRELGMEEGLPEHLNVSLVTEADLKRLSSDPFRQEAPPSPAPAETPAPPPEATPPPAPPAGTPAPSGELAGAPAAPLFFRPPTPVSSSGVLNAGDAAGFIDPFAGDGIAIALRSGAKAATASADEYGQWYGREVLPAFRTAARFRRLMSTPAWARTLALSLLGSRRVAAWAVRATRSRG